MRTGRHRMTPDRAEDDDELQRIISAWEEQK